MRLVTRLVLAIIMAAATTMSLSAHHSFAMFEMDKDVEYSGIVVEWKWQNPHVHFTMHVKGGAGVNSQTVGTWDVEGGSINIMSRQGWTRASYKSGDPIRARRTSDEGRLERDLALLRDQTRRHEALPRHCTTG